MPFTLPDGAVCRAERSRPLVVKTTFVLISVYEWSRERLWRASLPVSLVADVIVWQENCLNRFLSLGKPLERAQRLSSSLVIAVNVLAMAAELNQAKVCPVVDKLRCGKTPLSCGVPD